MTIRHAFNMRNTMGATNGAGFANPSSAFEFMLLNI
jgi:hypothetical protein